MGKRKSGFTLRKRSFLNPASTGTTSHVFAEVESSNDGTYPWGQYLLTIADCNHKVRLEFFLGTKAARRLSLKKINLLVDVLTKFRDCLTIESTLLEEGERRGPTGTEEA